MTFYSYHTLNIVIFYAFFKIFNTMRFQLLIDNVDSFVKFAGRIPAEKYSKQIYDIIEMYQNLLRSRQHYSIGPGQSKDLGSVSFDLNGTKYDLPIKAISDKDVPIRAGVEAESGKAA